MLAQITSVGSDTDRSVAYDYRHIMVAVDNSPLSNQSIDVTLALAGTFDARVTAAHAYAAKLHDLRFRQMEGGLPEKYRKEDELERQRDVHDSLITRGLGLITDSYLDVVEERAKARGHEIARRALEGKNYRALLDDIAESDYDLVVLGALGLGAVKGSLIGTVCERVVREAECDLLVVKDPELKIGDGPVMVTVDGSARSFGGLKTAILLAQKTGVELEVVSAFDPFFHYVAFDSIASVLSDEAGQVFKFKEQEKLHEEIIDSGLAKIYQAHLAVAAKLAAEEGVTVTTKLLAGKPFEVIQKEIGERKPSLLVLGKTGVHADAGLRIGGTTENLLRLVPCHVLITTRAFEPKVEQIADETTSWTEEAEQRMERVPSFVRNMARSAILRYAHEQGHTVVSSKIVDEATANLLPASAMQAMGLIAEAAAKREQTRAAEAEAERATNEDGAQRTFDGRALQWSDAATAAVQEVASTPTRANVKLRAEKLAFREQASTVTADHVGQVIGRVEASSAAPAWDEEALARLQRVPEGLMRDRSRQRVEGYARREGLVRITLEVCEAGLEEAKTAMAAAMQGGQGHPQTEPQSGGDAAPDHEEALSWTPDAEEKMQNVPVGFMRELTRQRVEAFARRQGLDCVTAEVITEKYAEWSDGSAKHSMTLPWRHAAVERIQRIPSFVRGMVINEAERCAETMGLNAVTTEVLDKASAAWKSRGAFHSDSESDLYE